MCGEEGLGAFNFANASLAVINDCQHHFASSSLSHLAVGLLEGQWSWGFFSGVVAKLEVPRLSSGNTADFGFWGNFLNHLQGTVLTTKISNTF